MRSSALVLAWIAAGAAALFAGCFGGSQMPEQPVRIVDKSAGAPASAGPSEALMSELQRRNDAVKAAGPERVGQTTDAAAEPAGKAAGGLAGELSVERLTAELARRPKLTPGEKEAYSRLLGASDVKVAPPAGAGDEYALLGQARDALLDGDYAQARAKADQALRLIRRKTDLSIDRFCFATEVRGYGDASVVSPAEFSAGQRVLVVTDISDFTCLPVDDATPPKLYYTKMSERLVIYDTSGKLYWQNSFGVFEYQSSHYISAMFVPQIFDLPRELAAGGYVLKVEMSDVLANRQAEASIRFAVK